MPFSSPFRDFVSGDFFFGFSGSRGRLVHQLAGQSADDLRQHGTVAFIDQLLTPWGREQYPNISRDLAAYLHQHTKYSDVMQEGGDLQQDPTNDVENNNLLWRRKSKGCLEFLVQNHFIHFAIDHELNSEEGMRKVVEKPTFDPGNPPENLDDLAVALAWGNAQNYKMIDEQNVETKNRVVTFSELRFAYRNRENPDFQKRLQFWWEQPEQGVFIQGPPPWEQYPNVWANYHPQSEDTEAV